MPEDKLPTPTELDIAYVKVQLLAGKLELAQEQISELQAKIAQDTIRIKELEHQVTWWRDNNLTFSD